ncbi:SIS domain-containing protein [Azohydromonas lata]|uniref:SIS domain-containing protein n=1 Tax=Azohydromonas lata TaxID=45677 RepID=UPI0008338A3B|nr:SIS domain-containing protein [Azohydromonas lata]
MLEQRIQQHFFESADLLYQVAETLSRPIADAAQVVVASITGGGKVLLVGQGPWLGLAQAFATQLTGRFERERPGLAALALGDAGLMSLPALDEPAQARQLQALGAPGDVLIALGAVATPVLVAAVQTAHGRDMTVLAFTGRANGAQALRLAETDVHIAVPHERTARILELHLLALHAICDAVDLQLMGEQDE